MKIFVYGTLKRDYWNHGPFIGGSRFIGTGRTAYRYHMVNVGFPKIYRSKKGRPVTGEVFDVDPARLPRLDQLEAAYDRVRGEIILDDGTKIWASYYVAKDYGRPLTREYGDQDMVEGDEYTWSASHG